MVNCYYYNAFSIPPPPMKLRNKYNREKSCIGEKLEYRVYIMVI